MDIEDLVKLGERGRVGGGCGPCPYYLALDMQERADIIFMPYNYLIDPRLRDQMGSKIPWKDAVLLFDEAHNMRACAPTPPPSTSQPRTSPPPCRRDCHLFPVALYVHTAETRFWPLNLRLDHRGKMRAFHWLV